MLLAKASQATLTVASTSGGQHLGLKLTTAGGSGTGVVSYSAVNGTASDCTITDGVLTTDQEGTCLVTATKASDANYLKASSDATTVTFAYQGLTLRGVVKLKSLQQMADRDVPEQALDLAYDAADDRLYVLKVSYQGFGVNVVKASTGKEIGEPIRIDGCVPDSLAYDSKDSYLYVGCTHHGGQPKEDVHQLLVYQAASGAYVGSVGGVCSTSLTYEPVTDTLYATCGWGNHWLAKDYWTVTRVNAKDRTVLRSSEVLTDQPLRVEVDPTAKRAYVLGPSSLTVLDATSLVVQSTLDAGANHSTMPFNPITRKLYAFDSGTNKLYTVGTATNTVSSTTGPACNPMAYDAGTDVFFGWTKAGLTLCDSSTLAPIGNAVNSSIGDTTGLYRYYAGPGQFVAIAGSRKNIYISSGGKIKMLW